jgi:multidrug efflux pump subunit AcrA (membrane-fusion protein)
MRRAVRMFHTLATTSIATTLLALLALLIGCEDRSASAKPGGERAPEPIAVRVQPAQARSVVRTVDVTGTLWGDQDITISAKVPGRIQEIYKDVGDRVAAGESLAQIDKTDYELEQRQKQSAMQELLARLGVDKMPGEDFNASNVPTVRRAFLQAANAEARYNRGKKLHEQAPPLISDQDFADLKTTWDVAMSGYDVELLTARAIVVEARSRQAETDIAAQRLADTTVRAPVVAAPTVAAMPATTNPANTSFGVASRMVSVGEYVQVGAPLYRVVADDPIKLRASVPERFAGAIKTGQTVMLRVEAYSGQTFTGTLTRINPQIDPANRTFGVEAVFANPDRKLQPGAFARAEIATTVQEGVVFVPTGAVQTFAGASKVFGVVEGKAKEFPVTTGKTEIGFVEIVSGMDKPMDVVIHGAGRLANDVPVTIEPGGTATKPAK